MKINETHTDSASEQEAKVVKQKLSAPSRFDYSEAARLNRIAILEAQCGENLDSIQETDLDGLNLKGNIESYAGSISIPMGICGPLKINEKGEKEDLYIPIATSEGALVSSITRGALAVSLCGGFKAKVLRKRMYRAPVFTFDDIDHADEFISWLEDNFDTIKSITKKYSNFADLKKIKPVLIGRNVHAKFIYECADASGQNMTTVCTWQSCLWIKEELLTSKIKLVEFFLEGNGSSDKKVSVGSAMQTRGTYVTAECVITEKVLKRILKTSSTDLVNLYLRSLPITRLEGMTGYNVNVANAVAAIFASTGQDLACIHESSTAVLNFEKHEKGLYVSLTLPSLVIGTVGGGTGLGHYKDCLKSIGCSGAGKVERFAKIIAGAALSLELSTMSAICGGQFAYAHDKLGRNNPKDQLKTKDITKEFINENFTDQSALVKESTSIEHDHKINIENGIITEATSRVVNKSLGFTSLEINKEDKIILKSKPLDTDVIAGFAAIAGFADSDIRRKFIKTIHNNEFTKCHIREIEAYRMVSKNYARYMPELHGTYVNVQKEAYLLLLENLNFSQIELMNTQGSLELWISSTRELIYDAISKIHKGFANSQEVAESSLNLGKVNIDKDLSKSIITYIRAQNYISAKTEEKLEEVLDNVEQWAKVINEGPKTLTHNDFNPRNICFKNGRPCFYDWELSRFNSPYRDLVEFMSFTTPSGEIASDIEYYFAKDGLELTREEKLENMLSCANEYLLNRVLFYYVGHSVNEYEFMPHIFNKTLEIIAYLEGQLND
ncbi:putative hydroxymethylglutaryl-CoA reductase (NADPH) [Bacteriovorax sp. BAL6_X]|uniref:phosphotransferase n=1 Tax=Bacteriovorax sp. BAL6_X TaxID=1201290 RepID=UPI000385D622|nr:phosphotransferase [Bacteriovorax sp. BAL6_X]EPZ49931.1 putative hydroxymethylglutaryl-CoA reductase (NADPH) [Bacteriovorax sp. BAL6_X]